MSPLGQFALLNPALLLALITAGSLLLWWEPVAPDPTFDPESPVEVDGWISGLRQPTDSGFSFPVRPRVVSQKGRPIRSDGEIQLYVATADPDPPLRYGDRIRFNSFLREPNSYAVPGSVDQRRQAWFRGRFFHVSLKSVEQMELLGFEDSLQVSLLRPFLRQMEGFLRSVQSRFPPRTSALLSSAIAGCGTLIPNQDWDLLRQLGLVHLLVVSGFHVGLLAAIPLLVGGRSRLCTLVTIGTVWLYATSIGLPTPATRAALAISLVGTARILGVRGRPLNLLGVAALVLILKGPRSVFAPGFQMSFLSVSAILLARQVLAGLMAIRRGFEAFGSTTVGLGTDWEHRTARRVRFRLETLAEPLAGRVPVRLITNTGVLITFAGSYLTICLWIQLFLLPLSAFQYNQVSLSAPLHNLLAGPLFLILLPLGFLFLVLHSTPLGSLLVAPLTWIGELFWGLAGWQGSWSQSLFLPQPEAFLVVLYLAPMAVILGMNSRWRWPLIPVLILAFVLFPHTPGGQPRQLLEMTLLDVGQAEAIHIRYPSGQDALIDTAGSSLPALNRKLSQQVVSRYLWASGVDALTYLLVTHGQSDHSGAYPFLARAFPLGATLCFNPEPIYRLPIGRLHRGMSFRIGEVDHHVLNPEADAEGLVGNELSVVVHLRFREFDALFTGDLDAGGERLILGDLPPLELLKVAHHGSRTSSSREFLLQTRPRLALISAGRRNPFGHPAEAVLKRLASRGSRVFTTARYGSLRVVTDGRYWKLYSYCSKRQVFRLTDRGLCRAGPNLLRASED